MKKAIILIFIFSFFTGNVIFAGNGDASGNPPNTTNIMGKVIDKNTMEELAGVTVCIEGTDIKTFTDIDGNFNIEGIQPGKYNVTVSYISYKDKEMSNVNVRLTDKNELEIKLEQVN